MTVVYEGAVSESDMDALLRSLERTTRQAFDSGRRVVFVFDTRRGMAVNAAGRSRMAQWMRDNDASSRATVAAFAFVMPSAVLRGALTAILWLAPMPAPHAVFADVGEAAAYARDMLRGAAPVAKKTGT